MLPPGKRVFANHRLDEFRNGRSIAAGHGVEVWSAGSVTPVLFPDNLWSHTVDMSEAPYRFDAASDHYVLTLYPLINEGQWGNVSQVGAELVARLEALDRPNLIVDLSPLSYMGSAQVALLVRLWKALKKNGGRMALQCPHEMVREVLAIAGLKSIWYVVDTRREAIDALDLSPLSPGDSSEESEHPEWLAPALAGTALAASGLALGLLLAAGGIVPRRGAFLLEMTAATVALLTGGAVAFLIREPVWRRFGTGVVVTSLCLGMVGMMTLSRPAPRMNQRQLIIVEEPPVESEASLPSPTDSPEAEFEIASDVATPEPAEASLVSAALEEGGPLLPPQPQHADTPPAGEAPLLDSATTNGSRPAK